MLTRNRLRTGISEKTLKSMDFVYGSVVWMHPVIDEGGEEAFNARFAMTEHIVNKHFAQPDAQKNPETAFSKLCETFGFDDDDVQRATRRACEDLKIEDPPLNEIAITAFFLWFAETMRENGDFDLEFQFFVYAIAATQRGNSELLESGRQHLTEVIENSANPFMKLASFCKNVLARL